MLARWKEGCPSVAGKVQVQNSDADVEIARELRIRQTTVYRGDAARLAYAEFERSCAGVENKFFVDGR